MLIMVRLSGMQLQRNVEDESRYGGIQQDIILGKILLGEKD